MTLPSAVFSDIVQHDVVILRCVPLRVHSQVLFGDGE